MPGFSALLISGMATRLGGMSSNVMQKGGFLYLSISLSLSLSTGPSVTSQVYHITMEIVHESSPSYPWEREKTLLITYSL